MIKLADLLREDVIEDNVIDLLEKSLPLIKSLGSRTVLTRSFSGLRMGVARVTTTPPKLQSGDTEIVAVFNAVMKHLDFDRLVYCSHGNRKFFMGEQYVMIPGKGYRLAWSPEISDLLVTAKDYKKEGRLDEFPYDTYTDAWPKGDVSEVLVDCDDYYLITTRIPIVQDYMRKQGMGTYKGRQFAPENIKTYNQLYDVIAGTLDWYKNK